MTGDKVIIDAARLEAERRRRADTGTSDSGTSDNITVVRQAGRRLLRQKNVLEKVGSPTRTTLWRWIRDHGFPEPIMLGGTIRAWVESEVDDWVERQPRGAGRKPEAAW